MVPKERRQKGDEPLIIDDAPNMGGGFGSGYYIHRVEHPNAPQLTQVQYYIVMKGNIKLFRRIAEEFRLGSQVLGDDYDAVTTKDFPRASTKGGKVFYLKGHKRKGLRTVHNDSKEEIVEQKERDRPRKSGTRVEQGIQGIPRGKEKRVLRIKPEEKAEEVLRLRMAQRLYGIARRGGRGRTSTRSDDLHSNNKEPIGSIQHSVRGQEQGLRPSRRVKCPKCRNSKHIIHNAMQDTYYCLLHPRAIAEGAMR